MNILANSSLAVSPVGAPPSGWSTATSSASGADGQPGFAQVVQETLNRTSSTVPEQQARTSQTATPANAKQQPAVVSAPTNASGEATFPQNVRDAANQTSDNAPEQQVTDSKSTDSTERAHALSAWLSTAVNSAIDANGEPLFAPGARGLLNRVSSNAGGQPVPTSNAPDSTPGSQTPLVTSSPKGSLLKTAASPKQTASPQAQFSPSIPGILQVPFTPILLAPTPDSIPADENAGASSGGTTLGVATLPRATSASGGNQVLQVGVDGSSAMQFFSLLQATLVSDGSVTSREDFYSPVGLADPTKDAGSSAPASVEGAEKSSVEIAASAATDVPSNTLSNVTSLAQTLPVKTEIDPQLSNPVGEEPSLSPVLQQAASLCASAAAVEGPRAAAQSQSAQATEKGALTPSSILHASATTESSSSSDTKAMQSASVEARSIDVSQAAASATNSRASSQDSSLNHGGQKPSDSAGSSDSSSTSPQAKNEFAAIADALPAVSAAKLNAAQPGQSTQLSNAAPPALTTPPPTSELPARPVAEPGPSDPAQAQQPSTPMQTPDAPSGRFVNDAQLMNAASQSEMHIAMQTNKLGAIEIHAHANGDEIGAAIVVDKRDAHAALAVELPALQQALSDKQLRVEQVVLTQGSLNSTAGGAGGNAQHQQRGSATPPQSASFWNEERSLSTAAWFVTEQTGVFNDQGRLSVQA